MLNKETLEKIANSDSQLLLVSKYLNASKTRKIFEEIKKKSYFLALGENRIDDIIQKEIPREFCHFIGNIQSRRISEISTNCSVIHSLCNVKHAEIFAQQENSCEFFIQINISGEPQKQAVMPHNFAEFYESLSKNIKIIGISGMGRAEFTKEEKITEFETLLEIREKFNPNWKISAGTSADYEIALEMGINIVRVGKVFYD